MKKMDEKDLFFGRQHTVAQEFEFFGRGLMTGDICSVRVRPAPENTGVIFRVGGGDEDVKLSTSTTYPGFHNITLRSPEGDVAYIEHLLSVFFAFGVDNVFVDVEGPEIPFFDGSALIFSERMIQVGLTPQNSLRRYFMLTEEVEVSDGSGFIRAKPSGEFLVHMVYHSPYGRREEFFFSQDVFYPDEVAPARTFIYEDDLKRALDMGLFKGGDLDSAVVFGKDDRPLNTELRFQNERARHKLLDFLGDLFTLGRVLGEFHAVNPSHSLTRELIRKMKVEVL